MTFLTSGGASATGQPAAAQDAAFDAYLRQDRYDGFDFARGPLLRVALLRLAVALSGGDVSLAAPTRFAGRGPSP